jgi:hypothetical protein
MSVALAPPAPGSEEALSLGCCCPVQDNNYGAGVPTQDGVRMFHVHPACQVHPGTLIKET